MVSGSHDKSICVWPTDGTTKCIKKLDDAHDSGIYRLALHESIVASGGGDYCIRIWVLPNMDLVNTLATREASYCICFHPSGEWMIAGGNSIQVWKYE
jgi:WD40 repeat protein